MSHANAASAPTTSTVTSSPAHGYDEIHEDEGHSVAGWVGVIVMLAAFALGTVAFFLALTTLFWVAVGLFVLGMILWPALKAAGFGPKHH